MVRPISGILLACLAAAWCRPAAAQDAPPLEPAWSVRALPSAEASPVVQGGRVWIFGRGGRIAAVVLSTGEIAVEKQFAENVRFLVPVEGGLLGGIGTTVQRLDAGLEPVWSRELAEPPAMGAAAEGGELFVGGVRGLVALVDAADGTVKWEKRLPWSVGRLALAGNVALCATDGGGAGGGLYVFDRATGALRWSAPSIGKTTDFALGRGVVYYGDAALRLADGSPVWLVDEPARCWRATPDCIAAAFGRNVLAGLDPATGEERWRTTIPGPFHALRTFDAPIPAGRFLVVAAQPSALLVVEASTGKLIARRFFQLTAPDDAGVFSDPAAVADGKAIVATSGGRLLALALPEGSADWPGDPAGGGQSLTPAPATLVAAEPPPGLFDGADDAGLAALAAALAIEQLDARAEALADVILAHPGSFAAWSARRWLPPILAHRATELSLLMLPRGQGIVSAPEDPGQVDALLAAKPIPTTEIVGLDQVADADLAAGLASRFYGRRASACFALARAAPEIAGPILVDRAEKDPHLWVRAAAVAALGRVPATEATRAVIREAFRHRSAVVRRCAVSASRVLGEEADELLAALALEDPDETVAARAQEEIAKRRNDRDR